MALLKFVIKNKRSFFYAFLTGLGLVFALQLLKDYGPDKFLIAISITNFVLILEIYINWRYATKVLRQIDMPSINVYNLWGHLINHITLPILLFLSLSGFVYFNDDDLIRIIAICFLVFINLILFINIRSYYEDEFKVEEKTRFVYDLIKLIIFFFSVNLVLHMKMYWTLDIWIIALLICFLALGLGMLLVYRKGGQGLTTTLYVITSSFAIAVIFMLLDIFGLVLLGINIIVFLLFYFTLAILHHRLERTLTIEVFMEYLLVLVLALLLFLGIS